MVKKTVLRRFYQPAFQVLSFALIGLVFIGCILALVLQSKQNPIPYTQQYQTRSLLTPTSTPINTAFPNQPGTYHSKFMQITFVVPDGLQVINDRLNTITLKGKGGTIDIVRGYTNYDSIDEYLNESEKRSTLPEQVNRQHVAFKGLDAVVETVKSPAYPHLPQVNYRGIFFYPAPWTIYSISTSVPSLYNTLDQVAQSIKFMP